MWGAALAVGLYALVINELQRIAVVEIIAIVVDNFAILNLATAEYQVIEYLATDESDEGAAGKERLIAETEFYAGEQAQFLVKGLLHVAEA